MRRLGFTSTRSPGFTLVEVLVVMAIIALLSTFLLANLARSSREEARREATRARIKEVELALTQYRVELGQFPPDLSYLFTTRTTTVVVGDASDPRSSQTRKLEPLLPGERMSQNGKDIPDAWGDPLHYDATRALGLVWSDNVNDK